MSYSSKSQSNFDAQNERLAQAFYSNGRYNPHFLAITGIGFFAIYILTRLEIFGRSAPQLIYIGILTSLLAAVQFPLLSLARRKKGIAAYLLSTLAIGVFTLLLTFFWQGIVPVSIVIALITPLSALRAGFSRRFFPLLFAIVLVSIIGILYAENNATLDRLQNSSPTAIATFSFLVATGLLLVTITLISENKKFKSLQTLLLTSFIVIVTIPTLMATILTTIGSFTTSEAQTFSTLKAVSNLKESQISNLIHDFQNDVSKLQSDPGFSVNALSVLTDEQKVASLLENSKRVVRARVQTTIGSEEEQYTEVMVLNPAGETVISTIPGNEGLHVDDQLFFQQGLLNFYIGFTDLPQFGNENLIVSAPIYDIDGHTLRGVVVLRSNAAPIKGVMENTPGFENAETYLVDKNYKPVTRLRRPSNVVQTQASQEAIRNHADNQQGIYNNYNGEQVLGNYKWFDAMQVGIIAEVPLSFVVASSLRSLVGSVVLALFVISIAIAAVAISARSIVHPITSLAETTEDFAAGKLSARAAVDRKDEIGALAKSYNQMASQLQEIIGGLESRVAQRTRALENQTLRLRLAAEIARDAASARDLSELLERSAELIQSRFGFYHTGIFLLDANRENVTLVASATEAGRQMLASNYRLRVGEMGFVGQVAATGEPQITLATGTDAVHFKDAYLPDTQSEMALPLKAEGVVIGVLDIQSDQPRAFNEDDITIMQTMADQLATAIERARLLQEVERSLKELESAYGKYTRENWKHISEHVKTGNLGYRFDNIRMESVNDVPDLGKTALATGKTVNSNGHSADGHTFAAVPVKLRGQTIGVINLKLQENFGEDTISTIELASERLAAALESARLYEEARLRADREQAIAQVTSAISASTNYEEILQTTVREIGNTLRDTEVIIQITGDTKDRRQIG
ncbi:MAG TPA: GAF domain-containing protein [Anaerolineales bacterium]|nr:GAF domain-containing protein [Anaerolineales bacterium]